MTGEGTTRAALRALAGATATAVLLGGCGGSAGEPEVRPLGEGDPTERESASGTSAPAPGTGTGTEEDSEALRAEVDDLLARYDAAFAALAADPISALDDTAATVRAWQREVLTGTRLDSQVRTNLRTDAELNRVLYQPDTAGVVVVTHAGDVTAEPDGSVTFDLCQFTPWLEVDADTGEVLDARPFRRTGSGTAVRTEDGRLVLEHLRDDRQVEVPSGSGDPCA